MADIQSKILSKYKIDIAQENIFKLYKIDSIDISPQELERKIQGTRKRWTTSVNGANEKNAERDRVRLEKADKYEAILKDVKLRKKVFHFYTKQANASRSSSTTSSCSTEFAKEYFELVATTKKIKKADVDFFFKYYQSERKNKKAILEMLSKDMKIVGLGKEEMYVDEEETTEKEGKKKDESTPLIVNLFQESTILKIRRAVEKFEEVAQKNEVCQRYPEIRNGLFAFLGINDIETAEQFNSLMAAKAKEVYAIRQERGTEYVPLVDLFNILQSIGDYQDVVDNIPEFKLLLKYPNLTPYMFAFVEMKPRTVKGLINVAHKDYFFRDDTDFILNYYQPIHDNFGISDSGIGNILRKAEKKAKQNKILNDIDKKFGRNKNKRKIPIGVEILHWLLYWPIFAVYFVFEASKAIFTELHRFAIPVSLILFGLESWLLPNLGIDNLLILRKIFFKNEWLSYLDSFLGDSGVNGVVTIILSLVTILILLMVYVIPPLVLYLFISEFADGFNKRFDWIGVERTFQQVMQILRKKTEEQYFAQKELFIKNKIGKVISNIVSLGLLIAIIIFAPVGFEKFSETTGYFQKEEINQPLDDLNNKRITSQAVTVNVESANISSGPNSESDVIMDATNGNVFALTGNQDTATDGVTWYEIYLDSEMTQTGWISQEVIRLQ